MGEVNDFVYDVFNTFLLLGDWSAIFAITKYSSKFGNLSLIREQQFVKFVFVLHIYGFNLLLLDWSASASTQFLSTMLNRTLKRSDMKIMKIESKFSFPSQFRQPNISIHHAVSSFVWISYLVRTCILNIAHP